MMRTILLYILLLLSALLTFSCKERPEVSSTLDRAETLIWESPDSALQLLEALPTSKRIDEESRARHALLLSQARFRCYVPTTSDSLINIALEYYQRRSDKTDELATAWFYKAALAKDMGCPHEEYLPYYKEAEALIPKLNDNYLIARIYHSLGLVNDDISHYGLAKEYYHKALKINENTNNIESQCSNLANLTGVYLMTDQWDSAQWCTDRLLGISSEVKDSVRLRDLYQGVGLCKEVMGEWDEAEKYYQKALSTSPTNQTLTTLAGVYIKTGQYEKADSIHEHLKKFSDGAYNASIYHDMYLSAREKGEYQKAFEFADEFIYLADSIHTESLNKDLLKIQHQYDLAVLRIHNSRIHQYVLYLCLAILIIAGIIWMHYKKRQKQMLVDIILLQETLLEEKANSASYLKETDLLKNKLEEHRKKAENDLSAIKNRYKYMLMTTEKESSGMNVVKKVLEEEQYNPNTDRESLKYFHSLTHKHFIETLDKEYPNMQNRIADVCYLAALGLSVPQIAQLLKISDISVRQYMNRFCKDIGLSDSGKKAFYIYIDSLLEFKRK